MTHVLCTSHFCFLFKPWKEAAALISLWVIKCVLCIVFLVQYIWNLRFVRGAACVYVGTAPLQGSQQNNKPAFTCLISQVSHREQWWDRKFKNMAILERHLTWLVFIVFRQKMESINTVSPYLCQESPLLQLSIIWMLNFHLYHNRGLYSIKHISVTV